MEGGLKIFARKGGWVRQNGGLSRNCERFYIVLRFFWRFFMMQHRKKIVIVLIVLTVTITILIIHANNEHCT